MIKQITILTISILLSISGFAKEKKSSKPNIIWLMAEDMSLDLACYGMAAVKTPNLDKMAAEGVKFNNTFVTNPICSPSRSAMMVGTHQVKINAHNHRSNRDVPLNRDYKPFTYWLRSEGYTAILGHSGVLDKGQKIDVNFKHSKLGDWDGVTQFGLFDKLNSFEKEDQPFFAQIQLKVTHRGDWWDRVSKESKSPVDPASVVLPDYYADHPAIRADWAKYLDQIEYMDSEVGMIFKELEDKGMADNTIVIFIGDNGRCNIRGKGYLHDAGLRIPLIVYRPSMKDAGTERNDVVSATDITATILQFAGIDIPNYMTGEALFGDKKMRRESVYSARDLWDEIKEKSRSISTDKWRYIRNDMPQVPYDAHQGYLEFYRPAVHIMRALNREGKLTDQQSFFFQPTKPNEELYDLENDPLELNNLAEDKSYRSTLLKFRDLTKDYDKKMAPVDTTFNPVMVKSAEVVKWVEENRPELYQQMLNGKEIGYKRMTALYKKAMKTNKHK